MCGRDKESIVDNGRLLIRARLAGKDGVPVRTWLVQAQCSYLLVRRARLVGTLFFAGLIPSVLCTLVTLETRETKCSSVAMKRTDDQWKDVHKLRSWRKYQRRPARPETE